MEFDDDFLEKLRFELLTRAEKLGGLGEAAVARTKDTGADTAEEAVAQLAETTLRLAEKIGDIFERVGYALGFDIAAIEALAAKAATLEARVTALEAERG